MKAGIVLTGLLLKIHRHLLLFLLPLAAAFAVYGNALSNGFIWDDATVLAKQLTAFKSIKDVFFPPVGIPEFNIHYYRPVIVLTLIADKYFWGDSAFGFHFSVILFHVLNTALIFGLVRFILKKYAYADIGAFVAALIFAVHPIHTESIAWMAGRSDVVAGTFFFSSLFLYLRFLQRQNGASDINKGTGILIYSAILFFFAAAAKETALSLIPLLPLIDISFSDTTRLDDPSSLKGRLSGIHPSRYIPFLIAVSVYFLFRHLALSEQTANPLRFQTDANPLLCFINSYGFYFQKLLFPTDLNAYIPRVPCRTAYTVYSITFLFSCLGLGAWFYVKRHFLLFFALTFFMLTILPSIMVAVLTISETPLAERYLYIPSFSLAMFAGLTVQHILIKTNFSTYRRLLVSILLVVGLGSIATVFSIQTVRRNTTWKSNVRFWEEIVSKLPGEGLPHLNLGLAYSSTGNDQGAEDEFIKALNARYDDEGRSIALNNLGTLFLERGDYPRAEPFFLKSISLRPDYPSPYYNIALIKGRFFAELYESGQPADITLLASALDYLNQAIRLNPQYAKARKLQNDIQLFLYTYNQPEKDAPGVKRLR